jgi:hypothetical protein
MLFATAVARLQNYLDKRRTYKRKLAEINDLSTRDLTDLRADRHEMIRHLQREVFGR